MTDTISNNIDTDAIHAWATHALAAPAAALEELYARMERHGMHRADLHSIPSLGYGNSLGCKIQSSHSYGMEDAVIDSLEEEEAIYCAYIRYCAARLNLRRMIDVSPLSDLKKQVVLCRSLSYPSVPYGAIGVLLGNLSKSWVFKLYTMAVEEFGTWGVNTEFYYPVPSTPASKL